MANTAAAGDLSGRQIAQLTDKKQPKEIHSLFGIALRRFLRHRMAVAGVVLITLVVAFVIGGSFFFTEADGNKTGLRNRTKPPSQEFPFGTDLAGRDVFIRTIYGGQISLAIGVTSVLISITVGTFIGLTGGYFGGWVDMLGSRLTEVLLAIPTLILLLVLSTVLSRSSINVTILGRELSSTVVLIVFLIGLTSWMPLSRIVRAQVLSLKEQEYITAAKAMGAGNLRIILRHLLPNLIAPIVVAATLGIGAAIITEAYLSFLGFGVQPPTATWGNIITDGQDRIDEVWWLWVFPGFLVVITVLAINFIGDGLRDALDPRSLK